MFYKLPKQFIDGRIVMLDAAFDPSLVSDNYPGGPRTDASATDTTTKTDTTTDISNLNFTNDSWGEKALKYVWDAASTATTAVRDAKDKAGAALDEILQATGIPTFEESVRKYIDNGFTTEEATTKTTADLKNAIDSSGMTDDQKSEALSYLDKYTSPTAENDPNSFEFFMDQFSNTKEGNDILTNMYNGHTQYSQDQYSKLAEEVTTQNGLLDSLLEQANTGTGVFSPITFSFGDINTTFVPRANRELATQMSELGQSKINNLLGAFSSGLAVDKLNQDAYQFEESDKNADQTREDNQPGILDYVKGVFSIF